MPAYSLLSEAVSRIYLDGNVNEKHAEDLYRAELTRRRETHVSVICGFPKRRVLET